MRSVIGILLYFIEGIILSILFLKLVYNYYVLFFIEVILNVRVIYYEVMLKNRKDGFF